MAIAQYPRWIPAYRGQMTLSGDCIRVLSKDTAISALLLLRLINQCHITNREPQAGRVAALIQFELEKIDQEDNNILTIF
jgi:hypothetical protein